MSNKAFSKIWIILIIIVIVASGIFIWQHVGKYREGSPAVSVCKMLGNKEDINFCIGIVTRDASYCDKADDFLKHGCLDEVASLAQDIELCRKIGGNCYCYGSIAALTQDLTICEEIKENGNADTCYATAAGYNQNSGFCQNIKEERAKTRCEYIAKGDPSLCKKLKMESDSIRCWGAMAILERNPMFCEETGSQKFGCYIAVAMKTKNEAICQEILNSDVLQPEYYYFMCMALVKEDISFCEELSSKGYSTGECLLGVARQISKSNIFSPPFGYVSLQSWDTSKEELLPSESPEMKKPEEEIDDWQIYRNEKYNFELKYPQDWEMEETGELFRKKFAIRSGKPDLHLLIYPESFYASSLPLVNTEEREIYFAGRKATAWRFLTEEGEVWSQIIMDISDLPRNWNKGSYIRITLPVNDRRHECGVQLPPGEECTFNMGIRVFGTVDQKESEFLNQILSTFKFVE